MSTAGKGLVRPGMPAAVEVIWARLGEGACLSQDRVAAQQGAWVSKLQVGKARTGQVARVQGSCDRLLLLPSLLAPEGKNRLLG